MTVVTDVFAKRKNSQKFRVDRSHRQRHGDFHQATHEMEVQWKEIAAGKSEKSVPSKSEPQSPDDCDTRHVLISSDATNSAIHWHAIGSESILNEKKKKVKLENNLDILFICD